MNAIFRAMQIYRESGSPRDFQADLGAHLSYGYVISRPDLFAMLRPVRRDAPEALLSKIEWRFKSPDSWLVWSVAGALPELLAHLPFELPWLAFHRGSARRRGPQPLKICRTERVRTLALHLAHTHL